MTFGSLFAGIGGIDLGLERAGLVCKWQVEIDEYCRRVLAKHWPDVPRWDDVKTFPPSCERCLKFCDRFKCNAPDECDCPKCQGMCECGEWDVDLICGGFPCQDISGAGKKEGINGERSGLWHEFARVVRVVRPRFVIVENVAAILLRGIDTVLAALAASGFDAEWDCFPASAFGAPHQRDRLFLVAVSREVVGGCRVFADRPNAIPRNSQWSATQGIESGRGWKRWLNSACSAVDGEISSRDFCCVDDGIPEGLGVFGNAVVPQVAEYIGRQLIAAL